MIAQSVHVAFDGSDRRAQLVADVADELVFHSLQLSLPRYVLHDHHGTEWLLTQDQRCYVQPHRSFAQVDLLNYRLLLTRRDSVREGLNRATDLRAVRTLSAEDQGLAQELTG